MLGDVGVVGEGLDAEVDEHCVGFPAAEQFDGVLVDVGAEQRRGAARAKAAGAEQGGINAGRWRSRAALVRRAVVTRV